MDTGGARALQHFDTSDEARGKTGTAFEISAYAWEDIAEEVIRLRGEVAAHLGLDDEIDPICPHFVARMNGRVVGAVRVNYADHSPFDFEAILPGPIPSHLRREVVSVSRLVVSADAARFFPKTLQGLIRAAWIDSWTRGYRASLVSAPEEIIGIYERLISATPISDAAPHPRTGRLVRIMKYVPSVEGRGIIDDLVGQLPGAAISGELKTYMDCLELVRC